MKESQTIDKVLSFLSKCKFSVFFLLFFATLLSCTGPIYQNTTYTLEEFVADSHLIAQGKLSIMQMDRREIENTVETCCPTEEILEETLMDGDILNVILYCPQRPDRVQAVQEINARMGFRICDGKIFLPHLTSREIEVAGLTLRQAQEKIQDEYCQQLPHSRIYLNFKKRHKRIVQVIGANFPAVIIDGQMRLSEVLAKAQLLPSTNLFKSYVMRNDQQISVDLTKLIYEGDESQNILMKGGDKIFIADLFDSTVLVAGEVFDPICIPVPQGSISLREALALAYGLPFTANPNCIYIIRGEYIRPKIYHLKWGEIEQLPNRSLLLLEGDIVCVTEKPITQWNRFINQLQPSAANIQTTYNLYEIFK